MSKCENLCLHKFLLQNMFMAGCKEWRKTGEPLMKYEKDPITTHSTKYVCISVCMQTAAETQSRATKHAI